MSQNHQPDPEFISNLEWQVRTALRREQRFSEPVHSRSGGRMQIAVLVLASALLGAGGVVVKDEVQEARRQELLLVEVTANQRMAELELDLVRTRAVEAQRQYEEGLISMAGFMASVLNLRESEAQLEMLELDAAEIRGSGKEPQNRLSAPRVDGRDFVTDRLEVEASIWEERIRVAQVEVTRAHELRADGITSQEDLSQALLALEEPQARLQEIRRRMELRQEVLAGTLTSEAAELAIEVAKVRAELQIVQRQWESSVLRTRHLQEQAAQELARESDLTVSRLETMQLETRLDFLRRKLEILEERGGEG